MGSVDTFLCLGKGVQGCVFDSSVRSTLALTGVRVFFAISLEETVSGRHAHRGKCSFCCARVPVVRVVWFVFVLFV